MMTAAIQLERLNDFRISKLAKVARTFQNIRLFPGMTALENLMVAQHNALMLASGLTFLGLIGAPSWRSAEKRAIDLAQNLARPHRAIGARRRRRRQFALRRSAPSRNRARHVHRAGIAVPGRAGRRTERARKCGIERAAALDPRRPGHLDPADRARHVGGDGNFRPRRGDGLRRQDRRRLAAGHPRRSQGDRGLSRRRRGRSHRGDGERTTRPRQPPSASPCSRSAACARPTARSRR